jgi:hypothetical protein
MKCQSLREAIVEMARGEDPGPGTFGAIESHLEHCEACAALLAREQRLSQGLRALSAAAPAAPSEALSRRLLDAFAERQLGQPAVARGANRIAGNGWLRAAAAMLVAAGGVLLWSSTSNKPESDKPRDASVALAEIRRPEAIQPASSVQSAANVRRGSLASRQPRPSRQRALPAVVRPVGFVALPGAAGLPDFESGEIVRMEIPLTSLPTYGIEILPDAQGSPVEADLLVGQDGQARAIRLVGPGKSPELDTTTGKTRD